MIMKKKWSPNVFSNKFDIYYFDFSKLIMDLLKELIILNRQIEIDKIVNNYIEDDDDEDELELIEIIKEKYKDLYTKKNHIQFKLIKLN